MVGETFYLQFVMPPPRKDAMIQYAKTLDLSEVYEESFRKLYESLRQVEMEEEYVQFIKENKK